MDSRVFLLVLIVTLFVGCTNSLKILGLFQHPGVSHFHFFHPIMRGLADAGHDVTVVSHFPDKNAPSNYKDLVLKKTEILTNSVDLEVRLRGEKITANSEEKSNKFHFNFIFHFVCHATINVSNTK